jgi:hypothetical protein
VEHPPQFNQVDKIRPGKQRVAASRRQRLVPISHTELARHESSTRILLPLKVLDRSFVFLRRGRCLERAEISSFPGFRIFLAGIQSVLTGFEFPDHDSIEYSQIKSTPRVEL